MSFNGDLFDKSQEEFKRQLFDSLTKKHGEIPKNVKDLVDDAIDAWIAYKKYQKELANKTGCRVVHWKKEKYDVYIGRPSKWGNPFAIGIDGTREEVIEKYRQYINNKPELLKDIHELKNKVLGCWCSPYVCHGDVLVELVGNLS